MNDRSSGMQICNNTVDKCSNPSNNTERTGGKGTLQQPAFEKIYPQHI